MSQVVNFTSEREARRSNEKAVVVEYVPLADGGIAMIAIVEEAEYVWEFNRNQAEILIKAMTLAFVSRKAVKVVQPASRSAA